MTIRWDNGGIPKGEKRTHHIGLNDLYSTLCDFADIKIPSGQAMDSHSFTNYAMDASNDADLRQYLGVWKYIKGQDIVESSIRKGEMKLIYDHMSNTTAMYNLTSDLQETTDVVHNHDDLMKVMKRKLNEIGPCHDVLGRFPIKTGSSFKRVSCKWFGRRPKRCLKFVEGAHYCGLTCALQLLWSHLCFATSKMRT